MELALRSFCTKILGTITLACCFSTMANTKVQLSGNAAHIDISPSSSFAYIEVSGPNSFHLKTSSTAVYSDSGKLPDGSYTYAIYIQDSSTNISMIEINRTNDGRDSNSTTRSTPITRGLSGSFLLKDGMLVNNKKAEQ
ncbi:hypothetical protein [Alteromonas australica]|uniref:hypothetical protein n=1 Tax=Alteromonas australica TaxID=589873 RepID=UPI00235417DA|nr:hypothetical protein [Alteromonas australica]